MMPWINLLIFQNWWRYPSARPSWVEFVYHGFNLFEGCVWWILAGLVARRYQAHRHSSLEIVYAFAFFTFGLTDFREAVALDSWLIGLKLINLIALFKLREVVIRRYYPTSRLY